MTKKHIYTVKILASIVGLLGGCFFGYSSVHALTLTPPRLEISGNPGQAIVEEMTVINERTTTETYYSSYANFEAQGESGAPAFVSAKEDLGTWMKVPESVTLAPGASKVVPVQIFIPKDASPGGHFAAVFWGNQPAKSGSTQVVVGAKTGMLVLLRVNGAVSESGGIVAFDTLDKARVYTALPIGFFYRFENAGGDRVKPVGDVVIKNTIGLTTERIPGNPVDGNVLPQSTRRIETVWSGKDGASGVVPSGFFDAARYQFYNFALGYYKARLNLTYGVKNTPTTSVVHLWVFPWQLLVCIFVCVLLSYLLIRTGLHHYNKWVIGRAEALLEEREGHFAHMESGPDQPVASAPRKRSIRRVLAKKKPRAKK